MWNSHRRQQLVAINARASIPDLLAAGATADEIRAIRLSDHRAQGLTSSDDRQAHDEVGGAALAGGPWLIGRVEPALFMGPDFRSLTVLELPESHWAGGSPEHGYFGIARPGVESQRRILQALRESGHQ